MKKVGGIIWFEFSLIKLNTSHSLSREMLAWALIVTVTLAQEHLLFVLFIYLFQMKAFVLWLCQVSWLLLIFLSNKYVA